MNQPVFFGTEYTVQQFLEELGVEPEMIAGIGFIVALYAAIIGAICLVIYIFRAIGIYNMAKTAGIANPWISFIPIVGSYTMGRLAEKYCRRDRKPSAKFGGILLVLNIFKWISSILLTVFTVLSGLQIFRLAVSAAENNTEMDIGMFASLIPVLIFYLLTAGLAIAYSAVHYVALWRIFASFDNKNATLFLVLSVFFGITEPIFLFVLRNKEPQFDPHEWMRRQFESINQ